MIALISSMLLLGMLDHFTYARFRNGTLIGANYKNLVGVDRKLSAVEIM